jgi:hypothetical protein
MKKALLLPCLLLIAACGGADVATEEPAPSGTPTPLLAAGGGHHSAGLLVHVQPAVPRGLLPHQLHLLPGLRGLRFHDAVHLHAVHRRPRRPVS